MVVIQPRGPVQVERRLSVGGVEILLRSNDARVLDEWSGPFVGYASRDESPHLIHEYQADPHFTNQQPAGAEYPSYGCTARSPGNYVFSRTDSRGEVAIPVDLTRPVVSRFVGLPHRAGLEASLRAIMSLVVPRLGGLILHSSGIDDEARAYVFSGPSGAGKTTISRLLSTASPRVRLLGDDLTILRPGTDGAWRGYATPFASELGVVADHSACLDGVLFLRQAPHHLLSPLPQRDALRNVLRNTLAYVRERTAAANLLSAASDLVERVPVLILEFRKDAGVAAVLGIT